MPKLAGVATRATRGGLPGRKARLSASPEAGCDQRARSGRRAPGIDPASGRRMVGLPPEAAALRHCRHGARRMNDDYSRALLDAVPLPIFVVDDDVRIFDFNAAAAPYLSREKRDVLLRRGGEVLHCIHATDVAEGCGRGPKCDDCVVRNAVRAASQGNQVVRRQTEMELRQNGRSQNIQLLVTAAPVVCRGQRLVLLVLEDASELLNLRRLLPICSHCKKIRDDREYWHSLETYMTTRLHLDLTHGICPTCLEKVQAELRRTKPRP
jgi:PAS domain-containing protein